MFLRNRPLTKTRDIIIYRPRNAVCGHDVLWYRANSSPAKVGVAKSQAEATFYHFVCAYLVYVKGYYINIKYILIQAYEKNGGNSKLFLG